MIINLDAGLDLRLIQENGYQRLSKLVNSDLKELTTLDKVINTNLKSLVSKRRSTTLSEGERKELENLSENLSKYKKNLKHLIEGKKAKMVPKTGQGMKSKNPGMKPKNPYKLTSDGMFGNLWMAYKDDKKVLSRKDDLDLIEILTNITIQRNSTAHNNSRPSRS